MDLTEKPATDDSREPAHSPSVIDQAYIDNARARITVPEMHTRFDEAITGFESLIPLFSRSAERMKPNIINFFDKHARGVKLSLVKSNVEPREAETIAETISRMYQKKSGYTAYVQARGNGNAKGP